MQKSIDKSWSQLRLYPHQYHLVCSKSRCQTLYVRKRPKRKFCLFLVFRFVFFLSSFLFFLFFFIDFRFFCSVNLFSNWVSLRLFFEFLLLIYFGLSFGFPFPNIQFLINQLISIHPLITYITLCRFDIWRCLMLIMFFFSNSNSPDFRSIQMNCT